jgi:hypothetical protein
VAASQTVCDFFRSPFCPRETGFQTRLNTRLTSTRTKSVTYMPGTFCYQKCPFAHDRDHVGLKSVCENSVLEGHGFSRAVNSLRASGLSAPEGIFYQRIREFGG